MCSGNHVLDYCLMSQVNPVKCSNRHPGIANVKVVQGGIMRHERMDQLREENLFRLPFLCSRVQDQ